MNRIYILLLSIILVSCSNDDDSQSQTSALNGEWNLVNITGGFIGMDQDFEKGIIVWNFNESTQKVTITNNSTIDGVYNGLPSGTYPYAISAPADADELIVNENSLGFLELTSNSFSVSEQFGDGFTIKFER
ncbi:hypothetical protein [Aquimarina sp. RZ0]|uniref:hypothetical protein n=1 Tax=Aquimarina sp. RZ0 TaxID=2607730 RepID=UPI0011F31722|nr:hypothetical protein [Aquimarina sp. RZ0]KAA1246388.1 hypothetical protein F0000_08050 [Aquimarina sp. RZ0]